MPDLNFYQWAKLGESAYDAYGAVVVFKNYQGKPMPKWDDLTLIIQSAWIAAAMEAIDLAEQYASKDS
jgi:hypothetical protein